MSVFITGDIGINHNGDIDLAFQLVDVAKRAGLDAVKMQKRNPARYPEREYFSPLFGKTTYRRHKELLELSEIDYDLFDQYCREVGICWFASCFDFESVDFISKYKPLYWKIASPCITNIELCEYIAQHEGMKIISTGMSYIWEIARAIDAISKIDDNIAILHCCSEYPCPIEHVNLAMIQRYKNIYPYYMIGYSSHDATVVIPTASVAMGAEMVEVHITLNRAMKGSDHAASLEPHGIETLVKNIRALEKAIGTGEKQVYEEELKIREKVRQIS